MQKVKAFFSPSESHCADLGLPPKPSDDEIRWLLSDDNSDCPLNKIIVGDSNKQAKHTLRSLAFGAYRHPNHSCRGLGFGIYCGPGQGKTYVVKCWAETIGIPYLFIQSDTLNSTWELFEKLMALFEAHGTPLVPISNEYHFAIPPCIVFLDEGHSLSKDLRTGGLLNAMETHDGWLQTSMGRNQPVYTIDCQEICWVTASTDPGLIFKQSQAFYDRFPQHVIWQPANKEEVAQIVKQKFPDLPMEACCLAAEYRKNPRKAVDFARLMEIEKSMMVSSWVEAAESVAKQQGIDQSGLLFKQIDLLSALGQRPIANKYLANAVHCRQEELEAILLPELLEDRTGRGPLVVVTPKGYALSWAGINELNKRGIKNKGNTVVAERFLK